MKKFKNILLVSPLDKHILEQANRLLDTHQAKLTLLSVAPVLELETIKTKSGRSVDLQTLMENDLQAELDEMAEPFQKAGKRIQTTIVSGEQASVKIIEQVITKKHDLVMMMADGVTSTREQLFGTLSMRLIRKCPCAVWVVKPTRRRKFRDVFAAVDPDPENRTRDGLNAEVLRRAKTIAQDSGARLHVVHAWSTLGGDVTRSRRWMPKSEIRHYVEQVADAHRRKLNHLLKQQDVEDAVVHMLHGRPGSVISEVVENHKADLLVMGTVCRAGIPGFFIGNTAESILNEVNSAVLTVKPKGFVSPITPITPITDVPVQSNHGSLVAS